MYEHLETNANALNVGDELTRIQIDAIAQLESNWSGRVGYEIIADDVERVLHVFICNALNECVCRVTTNPHA